MRLAVDATPLLGRPTGVGEFTRGLLGGLMAHGGLDVVAYGLTWRGRGALASVVPAGVVVAARPMAARPLRTVWAWLGRPPIEWWTGPCDVVHGTNFVVPPARRAARVVSVHDLTPLHFPQLCSADTLAYPAIVRRAVAEGAWVHTHAEAIRLEVIEAFAADPDRVVAVPSGVPSAEGIERADPAEGRRLAGLGAGGRYVLALGTVEPRKDLPSLVAAFDAIAGRHRDTHLVIAGPDGWGSEDLARALDRMTARHQVTRLGYVSDRDRDALVRGAAVLAYPSRYEGFGYPPLQAMAAGVPVVATAAGSLAEVLADAALVVPVGDVERLAGALDEVLTEPVRAAELAERGRQRAARFSWARCARGMTALYEAAAVARGPLH